MRKAVFLIGFVFFAQACSKSNTEQAVIENPTSANLIFPFESSVCNEGTDITATESTVLFEWEGSGHTDSYELVLRNLSTGDLTTHQVATTQFPITIQRGTPYEWYVISKSNAVPETAQSAIWRFYNSGEGIESYAPFPAEIVAPAMAGNIANTPNGIILDWNGNDVDNDIAGYDVYLGTIPEPLLLTGNLSESTLTNVAVTPNTIYYWRVVTRDSRGNTSDSGIFQFKVL